LSRGVPAGSGCALYGPGPSRVKGAAHRCATACGPPLTREPLPALGQALSGRPWACPMGARSPSPLLWVDRVWLSAQDRRRGGSPRLSTSPFQVFV
jgi:hypothetical protein